MGSDTVSYDPTRPDPKSLTRWPEDAVLSLRHNVRQFTSTKRR